MAFRSESLIHAEMSEWFKEHDWKSCVGLKPTGGSNPLLCAIEIKGYSVFAVTFFCAVFCRFYLHTIFSRTENISSMIPLIIKKHLWKFYSNGER